MDCRWIQKVCFIHFTTRTLACSWLKGWCPRWNLISMIDTQHTTQHTTHTHTPHGIWRATHRHTHTHTHTQYTTHTRPHGLHNPSPSPHTHTHTNTACKPRKLRKPHTHTHSSDYPLFCQTNNFGTVEWVNKTSHKLHLLSLLSQV